MNNGAYTEHNNSFVYRPLWCAKQADGIIIYKGDVKLQPCTKMDDWCFSIQTGVIMKKILVAVDSFKGSMTSLEAGNAIKKE